MREEVDDVGAVVDGALVSVGVVVLLVAGDLLAVVEAGCAGCGGV